MSYLVSSKSPVVTLPWLREELLQDPDDEVELEMFERALNELLASEIEWEDRSMLTIRLRPQGWKAAQKKWK